MSGMVEGISRLFIIVAHPEQWKLLDGVDFQSAGITIDPGRLAADRADHFLKDGSEGWLCKLKELKAMFDVICKVFADNGAVDCTVACDTLYGYPRKYYALWFYKGQSFIEKNYMFNHNIPDRTAMPYKELIEDNPITKIDSWLANLGAEPACRELFDLDKTKEGYTIVSYKADADKVRIPETINGIKVVRLAESSFAGKSMRSVELAYNLKEIGEKAFSDCSNLETVDFHYNNWINSHLALGKMVFQNCRSLKTLILPESISELGESVLYGCPLDTVTIPSSVNVISENVLSLDGNHCLPQCVTVRVQPNSTACAFFGKAEIGVIFKRILIKGRDSFGSEEEYLDYLKNDVSEFDSETHNVEAFETVENPGKWKGVGNWGWSGVEQNDRERIFTDPTGVFIYKANIADADICYPETINGLPVYGIRLNVYKLAQNDPPRTVYIPKTVKYVLTGNMNVGKITVSPENPYLYADESGIFSKDRTILYAAAGLDAVGQYTIPESVERIEADAFEFVREMKKLHIGSGLKSISTNMLDKLAGLQVITVSEDNRVLSSDGGCLYSKDKTLLLKVPDNIPGPVLELPEHVTDISADAFGHNTGLEKLILSKGITKLDDSLFDKCSKLKDVTLAEGADPTKLFYEIENGDTLIHYRGKERRVVIPEGIKYIGCTAFLNAPMEEVVFPKGLLAIESLAFCVCSNLKSIEVPLSVFYIGQDAFANCTSLEKAVIPANAVSTDRALSFEPKSGMFYGCRKLRELRLEGRFDPMYGPKPFRYTEHRKFGHNVVFMSVYIGTEPGRERNLLGVISPYALAETSLRSITATGVPLSAFIKEWSSWALTGFIEAVMSGETVDQKIAEEYYAAMDKRKGRLKDYINNPLIMKYFIERKMISIKKVDELIELASKEGNTEVTALLLNYKNDVFTSEEVSKQREKDQRKLERELDNPSSEKKKVKIEDKTSDAYMKKTWVLKEELGEFFIAKYKGEDTDVVFPSVVLGKRISGITSRSGKITDSYANLETVVIPDGYTTIGKHAFDGCTKLRQITIPMTVENIEDEAFNQCSSLKSVILPHEVYIGKWAFRDCFSLKDVYVMNKGGTLKGNAAFRGSTSCMYHVFENSRASQEGIKRSTLITEDDIKMVSEYYFKKPLARAVKLLKPATVVHVGDELTFDQVGKMSFATIAVDQGGKNLGDVVQTGSRYKTANKLFIYKDFIKGVVTSEAKDLQWGKVIEIEICLK